MPRAAWILLLLCTSCPLCAQAQSKQQQLPSQTQAQDGGSSQMLQSIVVPNLPNAPFTVTLHTEWVRGSSDTGKVSVVNQRRIARDSSGRIFQERWYLVPKDGEMKSHMTAIQISDLENHTLYTCMMDGRHVCDLRDYFPPANAALKPEPPFIGPMPDYSGFMNRENLGTRAIAGVATAGVRETITYNPGVFGNDQKVTVSREYWYSSQFGFNLLSMRSDPRFGSQTFTVTSLDPSEPDPQLFELPQGFKVVDHRSSVTPASN